MQSASNSIRQSWPITKRLWKTCRTRSCAITRIFLLERCGVPNRLSPCKQDGQLNTAAEYRSQIVTYRNGSAIRIEDLGRAFDGIENDKQANWFQNRPSIVLQVFKQPGTNTVEIVDRLNSLMPTFRNQLPPAVNLDVPHRPPLEKYPRVRRRRQIPHSSWPSSWWLS